MSTGRLLIVDDTAENLKVLHGLLTAEGYTVLTAMRGEIALRAAAEPPPPELILLDVRMPGMDGYEICRRLKDDPATRDIPVLFISAGSDIGDKVAAFRSGGVDYLTKPLQVEEVLARVATHLALSRQRREIAALSALKDQLIRTISHDLKNPLTVVLGATELLRTGMLSLSDADARSLLDDVHERGEEMLQLVTSLLDLSRIEEGMPLQRQGVEVKALLEQQAERARSAASARGVALTVNAASSFAVDADPERLSQVLANLLSNAVKYTPAGGTVALSAVREGDRGGFRVEDTGLGIPVEAVPRLFERFYRVPDPAHLAAEGTGLGLSIVKGIVDQHGGEVRVESTPGQGSRFTVLLPLRL